MVSFLTWKKWVKRQLADFEVTSGKNDLNVIAVDILVLIVWGQILILFGERRADPLGTAAIYTPTRRLHAFSRLRTTDVLLISKRPRIDAPFDVATQTCEIRKKVWFQTEIFLPPRIPTNIKESAQNYAKKPLLWIILHWH